jgi:hypothetical protein
VFGVANDTPNEGIYLEKNTSDEMKIKGDIFSDSEVSFQATDLDKLDKIMVEGNITTHGAPPENIDKVAVTGRVRVKEVGEEPLLNSYLSSLSSPQILSLNTVEITPLPPLEPELNDPPWISSKGSTKEQILDTFESLTLPSARYYDGAELIIDHWPYHGNNRIYVKGDVKFPESGTIEFGENDWLVAEGDIIFPEGSDVYINGSECEIGLIAGGDIRCNNGAVKLRVRLYAFGNIKLVVDTLQGDWIQAKTGNIILYPPREGFIYMVNGMGLRDRMDVKAGGDIRVLNGNNSRHKGLDCDGGYWSAGRACIINLSSYEKGDGRTPTEIRTGGTVRVTLGSAEADIYLESMASNFFRTWGRPHPRGREVEVGILLVKDYKPPEDSTSYERVHWETSLHAQGDIYVFSRGKCGFYFGYETEPPLEVRTKGNFITVAAHLGKGGLFGPSCNFEIGKDCYFFDISRDGIESTRVRAKGTEGKVDVGDDYPARQWIVDKGIIWVSREYYTHKHYLRGCKFYTEQGIAIIAADKMRVEVFDSEFYCNKDFYTANGHLGEGFSIPGSETIIHAGRNIIFKNYGGRDGQGGGIKELKARGGEELIDIGDSSQSYLVEPGIIFASTRGTSRAPVSGKWYSGKSVTFIAYNGEKDLNIQPRICNARDNITFLQYGTGNKFEEIGGNYHAGGDIVIGALKRSASIKGIYKAGGEIKVDLYPSLRRYHNITAGFRANKDVKIGAEGKFNFTGCIVSGENIKLTGLLNATYDDTIANTLLGEAPSEIYIPSVSKVHLVTLKKSKKF